MTIIPIKQKDGTTEFRTLGGKKPPKPKADGGTPTGAVEWVSCGTQNGGAAPLTSPTGGVVGGGSLLQIGAVIASPTFLILGGAASGTLTAGAIGGAAAGGGFITGGVIIGGTAIAGGIIIGGIAAGEAFGLVGEAVTWWSERLGITHPDFVTFNAPCKTGAEPMKQIDYSNNPGGVALTAELTPEQRAEEVAAANANVQGHQNMFLTNPEDSQ